MQRPSPVFQTSFAYITPCTLYFGSKTRRKAGEYSPAESQTRTTSRQVGRVWLWMTFRYIDPAFPLHEILAGRHDGQAVTRCCDHNRQQLELALVSHNKSNLRQYHTHMQ